MSKETARPVVFYVLDDYMSSCLPITVHSTGFPNLDRSQLWKHQGLKMGSLCH